MMVLMEKKKRLLLHQLLKTRKKMQHQLLLLLQLQLLRLLQPLHQLLPNLLLQLNQHQHQLPLRKATEKNSDSKIKKHLLPLRARKTWFKRKMMTLMMKSMLALVRKMMPRSNKPVKAVQTMTMMMMTSDYSPSC